MTLFVALQKAFSALSNYQWRLEAAFLIGAFDLIVMGAIRVSGRIRWRVRLYFEHWLDRDYSGGARGFGPAVVLTIFQVTICIAVLAVLGMPLSVLGALLSAGIALGIFSDAYIGTTFLLRLPYQIGDFIEYREQGIKGTISALSFSTTQVRLADGSDAIIPNRKLAETIVFNHARDDHHWLRYSLIVDQAQPIATIEQETQAVVAAIGEQVPYPTAEVRLVSLENQQLRLAIRLRVGVYQQEVLASELIKKLESYCAARGLSIHRLAPETDASDTPHP